MPLADLLSLASASKLNLTNSKTNKNFDSENSESDYEFSDYDDSDADTLSNQPSVKDGFEKNDATFFFVTITSLNILTPVIMRYPQKKRRGDNYKGSTEEP